MQHAIRLSWLLIEHQLAAPDSRLHSFKAQQVCNFCTQLHGLSSLALSVCVLDSWKTANNCPGYKDNELTALLDSSADAKAGWDCW